MSFEIEEHGTQKVFWLESSTYEKEDHFNTSFIPLLVPLHIFLCLCNGLLQSFSGSFNKNLFHWCTYLFFYSCILTHLAQNMYLQKVFLTLKASNLWHFQRYMNCYVHLLCKQMPCQPIEIGQIKASQSWQEFPQKYWELQIN